MPIQLFKEDISIDLRKIVYRKKWLIALSNSYKQEIDNVNYIFCSDEYLHQINKDYLLHDNYTDIITFDNREEDQEALEADIFISVDRVNENAKLLQTEVESELSRVMAHGLLHLIGFKDKSEVEKDEMRKAEDQALKLLSEGVPRGTIK